MEGNFGWTRNHDFFFFFNRLKVGVGGLALSGDMGCDMCIVPELWERVRRRNGGAEGLTT